MPRPSTTGRYSVPADILALKPKDIPCLVKVISTTTNLGRRTHYYVYELISVPDTKHPGKNKQNSGSCLGKIEGGVFCPNKAGIRKLSGSLCDASEKQETGNPAVPSPQEIIQHSAAAKKSASEKDNLQAARVAANMNLSLKDVDLQVKDYGEYAIVLACTGHVLDQLDRHFSTQDARLIYALGLIYFIQEYTPASYVRDVYQQSILSNKWPSLAISENTVNDFLRLLGRHPVICEEYSQELINSGSGLTAIDGHVILSCSHQNCLADYGNKYQKIGNKQLNILEAYDVVNEIPLTSKAYEGGLPDKTSVQDLFVAYTFPGNTVFLVDMGFYSEENLGLYCKDGKQFVIPVPETTAISKAIDIDGPYEGSFFYQKTDENGLTQSDKILYRETTVRQLEDAYQEILNAEAERKNSEEASKCKNGEKPKKHYARKLKRSAYGDDRIIICRDEDMHAKMISEFRSQIGSDEFHTEDKLAALGPGFGVIVLRTNLEHGSHAASDVYCKYKQRWKLETHYNFVENIVRFCGLKTDDYYSMQGLSFLIQIVGQIKSAFMMTMRSSPSTYVSHLSVKECLTKAGHLKMSQHINREWHVAVTTKKIVELMKQMGADIEDDVKRLNSSQF